MKKITFIILLCLAAQLKNIAQSFFTLPKYPTTQFSNPMEIPISLSGNFGECRPNHFHSGLDIRTNKVENLPVHSIGNGYISRIKIDNGGFGNAIYINHIGGYTSLYAHLNKFYPELEAYVKAKQYEQKRWNIDILLTPNIFPLMKGKFLAYSGNTGSSQAPHLHLEIRDTKTEKPLNGLLFLNLPDNEAPKFKKIALYDANKSIYNQSPKQLLCVKKGNDYKLENDTVILSSNALGMGIVAMDPLQSALHEVGVFEANVYVDNKPIYGWQLNNIGYEETRYMNAMADYKTKMSGGNWIQLLYKMPGDQLKIYKSFNNNNGKIVFENNIAKQIKVCLKDVSGNESSLVFWAKTNVITGQKETNKFEPNRINTFNDGNISFKMPATILYDGVSAPVQMIPGADFTKAQYVIFNKDIPAHDYFDLKLKPQVSITGTQATKVAFIYNGKKGKAAKMQDAWAVCAVREFGNYSLKLDNTAPVITGTVAPILKTNKIIIKAKEETTSVANFTGTIDNKWVCFAQKGENYTYELDKYCGIGTHNLVITASDENGNTSSKTFNFEIK
jgi:hypothetical protein